MENRINTLFRKKRNILSVYFTAGYPELKDTGIMIRELEQAGADMIEVGMPFSDPLADGPTIQHSSEIALENGMTIKILFQQLPLARCQVPILLMGYLNPVLQFGMENFCKKAKQAGVDGAILPDLPIDEYLLEYKAIFEKYDLRNIFLVTPQTSEDRIRYIDEHSDGFIYMVSSASTTGTKTGMDKEKEQYFARIQAMKLKNPLVVGFGINDRKTFSKACEYANGAIIGSAFVMEIGKSKNLKKTITDFIKKIR